MGAFVVHSRTPRVWTALERTLVHETAERTWAALERAEVEERLRSSERMMDEAQRVARLGSWELDLLTGSVRWSRQAYANYGVSPDTFTPSITAFRSFVHPDDRERVERAASEVMSKAAPVDIEYRIVAGDGVTRVLHARGEVTRVESDGTPRVMTGVAQDVTERRQKEEQERLYQQSQERLRDLDALERLQRVGARLVRDEEQDGLLGEILEAAIAIAEADFGNIQVLEPETSELRIVAQRGFPAQWVEFWDRASKEHGASSVQVLDRGERVIIKDISKSELFDAEMREAARQAGVHAVQSTPLLSRSGAPLGVISTHYRSPQPPSERALRFVDLLARQTADFLERNANEAALRRSEAIASSILMTSADAILSLDAQCRIVRFNAAAEAIFGYKAAEVLGGPLDLLLPERRQHRVRGRARALRRACEERVVARVACVGRRGHRLRRPHETRVRGRSVLCGGGR